MSAAESDTGRVCPQGPGGPSNHRGAACGGGAYRPSA